MHYSIYLCQGKQNWKASIGVDINHWVFCVVVWDIPDHTRTRLAVEKTSTKCQEHSTFPSSHASLCSHWNDGYPLYPGRTRAQLWGRTLTLNLNLWSDFPKIKWGFFFKKNSALTAPYFCSPVKTTDFREWYQDLTILNDQLNDWIEVSQQMKDNKNLRILAANLHRQGLL
jgi:hypothetical protein